MMRKMLQKVTNLISNYHFIIDSSEGDKKDIAGGIVNGGIIIDFTFIGYLVVSAELEPDVNVHGDQQSVENDGGSFLLCSFHCVVNLGDQAIQQKDTEKNEQPTNQESVECGIDFDL